MKRENSRFSTDELNQVISNWEKAVALFNGKIYLRKKYLDKRGLQSQIISPEDKTNCGYVLYWLDISIIYKGLTISIQTKETKPPVFECILPSNNFTFSVGNEDYIDKFLKIFGSSEIQIGDYEFDNKFLINANDKRKINDFLDQKMKDWLMGMKIGRFCYNTPYSKNKLSLIFNFNEYSCNDIINNINMFIYCIDKLKANAS